MLIANKARMSNVVAFSGRVLLKKGMGGDWCIKNERILEKNVGFMLRLDSKDVCSFGFQEPLGPQLSPKSVVLLPDDREPSRFLRRSHSFPLSAISSLAAPFGCRTSWAALLDLENLSIPFQTVKINTTPTKVA